MDNVKGKSLDKFRELYWIKRKIFKTIPLLFGWKLVKEERDKDFRKRILSCLKNENCKTPLVAFVEKHGMTPMEMKLKKDGIKNENDESKE